MSTTVMDALLNAQMNFATAKQMGGLNGPVAGIAMEQLANAIKALENDFSPNEEIQESMGAEVVTTK